MLRKPFLEPLLGGHHEHNESVCVCGGGRSDANAWCLSSSFLLFVVAAKMRAGISEFFFSRKKRATAPNST